MLHPRASLSLLLALSLPGLLPVALAFLPSTAAAQAAILPEPLVDLVPVDEIVGDGQTTATLHIVAIGIDGGPISGLSGRLVPAQGEAGPIEELSPGRYRVLWTPPAIDATTTVELTLRVRPPQGTHIVKNVQVSVVPPLSHSVSVTASPRQIILGQDPSATVNIHLSGGAQSTLSGADLAVQASSGTVANITPLGRGQYSLLFTPPAKKFPQLALITVSDRRNPSATLGALALPLVGRAPFPVTGQPDSSIVVRVANQEFGPVQANAQGKAVLTLSVPPGTSQATVISEKNGVSSESTLDLKVPPTPRIQLFPLAPATAADGRTPTPLRVFVAEPDGRPDAQAKVSFHVSTGSLGPVRHEGGGIYAAVWTPAVSSQPTTAKITVEVEDSRGPQQDSIDVRLLPARPETIALESVPRALPAEGGHFKVRARVTGPTAGHGVSFAIIGAMEEAAPADHGQGFVEAGFHATADDRVVVQAAVVADASSNPLARVLVLPALDSLAADGSSQLPIVVLSVDTLGYPVGNTPIALAVTQGDATIAPTVTTDAYGIAHTLLNAGTSSGMLAVQAATGGHIGTAGVLQIPAAAAASGVDLPVSGDTLALALRERWEPLVKGLAIPRQSAAQAAAAMAATAKTPSGKATDIAVLEIIPDAPELGPGQTVNLTIRAMDQAGNSATGRSLQIFTNAGTVTAVQDQGNGGYQCQITAPRDDTTMIRVTVLSPESGVSAMVELPVSEPVPAWGIAAKDTPDATAQQPEPRQAPVMPTTQPEGQTTVEAPPQPTKPTSNAHPWLRAQGGFLGGFYSYRQVPFTARGPLYGDRIAFGGGETPAAGSAGLALRAAAWLPALDFLGARASFRSTRYAVEIANFNAIVPDWVNDTEVLGLLRYPIDVHRVRLSPALRVGGAVNDFMIYRQDTTGATPVMNYGPLIVPSFNFGGELSVDVNGRFFAQAGATLGLNGGSGLYSKNIGGSVGFTILDPIYLYGSLDWMARSTTVYVASDTGTSQQAGELDDGLTSFGAGIGFQL